MVFRKLSWLLYLGAVALIVLGSMDLLAKSAIAAGIAIIVVCIAIEMFLKLRASSTTDVLNKLSKQRDRGEISQAQFEAERQKYFSQRPR